MNTTQQIFVVFFAIFWGTSSNAWLQRKPFHWPLVGYGRVLRRVVLSVLLLNVVPIAYFAFMFNALAGPERGVVVAILPAFAVFGIYRVWLAAIEFAPSWFYYNEKDLPGELKDIEPIIEKLHPSSRWRWHNSVFGLAYVFVATVIPLALG